MIRHLVWQEREERETAERERRELKEKRERAEAERIASLEVLTPTLPAEDRGGHQAWRQYSTLYCLTKSERLQN